MTQFAIPASVPQQQPRCTSTAPLGAPPPEGVNPSSTSFKLSRIKIPCELDADHHGELHRNGPLTWHDPFLLTVGGVTPDVDTNTEHWQHGDVLFSWEEPSL